MGSIYKINKEIDNIRKDYEKIDRSIEEILSRLSEKKVRKTNTELKEESLNTSELFLGIVFLFNTFSNIAILIYLFYIGRW